MRAVILSRSEEPDFHTSEILEVSDLCYEAKQIQLSSFISRYYFCSLGEALALMVPFSRDSVQAEACVTAEHPCNTDLSPFQQEEILQAEACVTDGLSRNTDFSPSHENQTSQASKIILSSKQNHAFEFLKTHKVSLLFGDTGSGKTEIYMSYFEEMLREGKRSIFLMPEISLTPQMSHRLEEHFDSRVVMWHSKLTPLQKRKALERIYDGSAYIVAGPRSALFLPVRDLGLIVVDEEHDDSYKSSSRPRYNARDLAIYMGKLYDAHVVLGSATPSLGSYTKFPHTRLKGGHFVSKKQFIYEPSVESLSPLILEHLKQTLDAKEQSILFIPTRANFKYLLCGDCGYTFECAFCSVGMSVHQKAHALKCHYCNYTQAIPQVCPECRSKNLTSARLGTAEAVQNLKEIFPDARIEQFDRDVITTQSKLKKALERFNEGKTDLLVGTQMLSKGHDYHGVTLAVVLGMDNMLGMSDYRAREKALSSLIQVAGRSGRAKDAKVLIQSFHKDFFDTYKDNYELFLQEEKIYREGLYPPYKRLCRILFSHKNGAKAQEQMHRMQERLRHCSDLEVVGFGKCSVERVANKYRFEILLRSDKSTSIIAAVNSCREPLAEIDMDPIEFG